MKAYLNNSLIVHSFPTMADLRNPWIGGKANVIINVSEKSYPQEYMKYLEARNCEYHHLPLVEEGEDMGTENILTALTIIEQSLGSSKKVLLHCIGGNNRSRTVAEAYCQRQGITVEDGYKGYPNHLVYNIGEGHLPCNFNNII